MYVLFRLRLVSLLFISMVTWVSPAQTMQQPNILLVVADDLGANDVGFAGAEFYSTPRIDQLSSQGMVFQQAYAAHPRCVPSRNALMTGQWPARNGQPGRGGDVALDADDVTIAEALGRAGYATFFAGKWHLGGEGNLPTDHGYVENVAGGRAGAPRNYLAPFNESPNRFGERHEIDGLDDAPDGEQLTDRLTAETIDWLRAHATTSEEPFFATVCYYAVHTPLIALPEDTERFTFSVPTRAAGVSEFVDLDGQTKTTCDNPVYAGMIWRLDLNVGRLLDALVELGVADNTIVVFTSDHGGLSNRGITSRRPLATSNLPLRAGKGHLYEGGIRVPMVVRWPGVIEPGSVCDAPVVNIDHLPTLVEAAGAAGASGLDGVSYAPILRGGTESDRGPIFWHSPRPRPESTGDIASTAVREGDWKLLVWHDTGGESLFNLAVDPFELDDCSLREPQRVARMRALIDVWLADVSAIEPRLTEGAAPSTIAQPDARYGNSGARP